MVKVEIEFESAFGMFRDAITLPDDHGFSKEEIEAIKQQRFQKWLELVTPQEESAEPQE